MIATDTRSRIYAAIPPLVALLVGVGIITDTQGAAIIGLAIALVGLAIAIYAAVTTGAPITRIVVYATAAGALGVLGAWGIVSDATAELILAAVMGIIGLVLAEGNTKAPPGERYMDADGDGRPDIAPEAGNG